MMVMMVFFIECGFYFLIVLSKMNLFCYLCINYYEIQY